MKKVQVVMVPNLALKLTNDKICTIEHWAQHSSGLIFYFGWFLALLSPFGLAIPIPHRHIYFGKRYLVKLWIADVEKQTQQQKDNVHVELKFCSWVWIIPHNNFISDFNWSNKTRALSMVLALSQQKTMPSSSGDHHCPSPFLVVLSI